MADERASRTVENPPNAARALIVTMRPRQWVKNLFVLAPLFFSKEILVPSSVAMSLLATFLFSMVAGTIYILNDIFDLENDRNHPLKCKRPIASGAIAPDVAMRACIAIGLCSLALGTWIHWKVGAVLALYIGTNIAYSRGLKNFRLVDVIIIAVGFLLRVLVGAFAIDVSVSEWILTCTFFLAFYLGLGKRRHEWILWNAGKFKGSRSVLKKYDRRQLEFWMVFVAGITIAAYSIYTLTASLPGQPFRSISTPFDQSYLPLTIPFTVYGVARFFYLSGSDKLESPTELIVRDKPFVLNIGLWFLTLCTLEFFLK